MLNKFTVVFTALSLVLLNVPASIGAERIVSEINLGSGARTSELDLKMILGDYKITRADEAAVILDLRNSETTDSIIRFAGNAPLIFARYNPNDAKGRIDIVSLDKTGSDSIRLIIRRFSPSDGSRWAQFRPSDGSTPIYFSGYNPFINPFTNFGGSGDGNWHNLSQSAFLTAVGMAQRSSRAHFSFSAIAQVRQDVQTSTSGNWRRRTTTQTVYNYVRPYWLLGLPVEEGGPERFTTAYCITGASPCPTDMLVPAGVAFISFNGGTMPMTEYLADVQSRSHSSNTVAWNSLVLGLVALAAAPIDPALAGTIAAVSGPGYAAITLASSGGSLTSTQDRFFGPTDSGITSSLGTGGFGDPTAAVTSNFVNPELNSTQGAMVQFYLGGCPENYTLAQCQSAGYAANNTGAVARPDAWSSFNSVKRMRDGHMPQQHVEIAP